MLGASVHRLHSTVFARSKCSKTAQYSLSTQQGIRLDSKHTIFYNIKRILDVRLRITEK